MKRARARTLCLVAMLLLAGWGGGRGALAQNALILNSAQPGSIWSDAILEGLNASLVAAPESIGRWVEYLDAYRLRSAEAARALADLYALKFRDTRLDVVIVVGGPALDFALARRVDLFSGIPIVFAGVSEDEVAKAKGAPGVTGVVQNYDYRATLDAALALRPKTRRLVFLSPEMRRRQDADALLPNYRPELSMEIWHEGEAQEILARARTLGPVAIIVPLAEPRGWPSATNRYDRFMEALTRTSRAPVFAVWDVALGKGIVGGLLTEGISQGRLAGEMALELMRGGTAQSLPAVTLKPVRLAFDARALDRFGIERASLPPGSELIGEPLPIYQMRPRLVWSAVGAFVFLTTLTSILIYLLASRRRAQQALAESEARFRSVFDHAPMSMSLKNLDGRYLLVNRAFEDLYGIAGRQASGTSEACLIGDDESPGLRGQSLEVIESGRAVEREHTLRRDGAENTVLIVMFPVRDADGRISSVGSCTIDISERKRVLEALAQSELRFQGLYDNAPDMYFTLTAGGVIHSVNRFGADFLGYAKTALESTSMLELVHPADRLQVAEEFDRFFRGEAGDRERKAEFRMLRNGGDVLWVHMRVRLVKQSMGGVAELRVICRDITDAHRLSEELAYNAAHDPLTGLVNRREFERRLGRALKGTRGAPAEHALCYMDLDQFKVVNDTCGHLAGDELLRQLGAALRERVRGRDVVARLGGDEFAIFMEHCPLEQAQRITEEIRTMIETFRFAWDEHVFSIGTSIGLVPVTGDSVSTVDVLSAADAACFVAKEEGRNRVHVYTPDSAELARHHGQMQWVARIQRALEHDEFELWCQPIVAVAGEPLAQQRPHMELLLRMTRHGQSPTLPGAFLPSAERFNFAVRVDRWVVGRALEWMASHSSWMQEFDTCFINLSGHSLADESFLKFVIERFRDTQIQPERICFEITETAAISNLTRAHHFMGTLKDEGCYFALDDFGSGLSSFAHLKGLPVDFLKIDGVFVKDIVDDPIDSAMVRSINEIGSVMGKRTIAEFVESADVLDMLRGIGVDYAQGYYLGRPTPLMSSAGNAPPVAASSGL